MFWNRKKQKYKPTGRIGYYRKSDYPWYYTVIFERLYDVDSMCKVKILEVSINTDCNCSKQECLKNLGVSDWVRIAAINWETDEQYTLRMGCEPEVVYDTAEDLQNDDVDYTPHTVTPYRHNFLQNEQGPYMG